MPGLHHVTVALDDDLDAFVQQEASRRGVASADFVRDVLDHRRTEAKRARDLDSAIALGVADAEAGRVVELEDAFDDVLDGMNQNRAGRAP